MSTAGSLGEQVGVVGSNLSVPVIAIDGASGTGKSTVAEIVRQRLGFRFLDSGAIYRVITLAAHTQGVAAEEEIVRLARALDGRLEMTGSRVFAGGTEVTSMIRDPEIDKMVAAISRIPEVREAVRDIQTRMREMPGLVAVGRDMWQVFPTPHMFFFQTDPRERATRRTRQLSLSGVHVNYDRVLADIIARDEADMTRKVSPLEPGPGSAMIDTTHTSAEAVAESIINAYIGKVQN